MNNCRSKRANNRLDRPRILAPPSFPFKFDSPLVIWAAQMFSADSELLTKREGTKGASIFSLPLYQIGHHQDVGGVNAVAVDISLLLGFSPVVSAFCCIHLFGARPSVAARMSLSVWRLSFPRKNDECKKSPPLRFSRKRPRRRRRRNSEQTTLGTARLNPLLNSRDDNGRTRLFFNK